MNQCNQCGDDIEPKRYALGYRTCLWCGEAQAKKDRTIWCVVPYTNKGAYMLITNEEHLKSINPKRQGY